MSRRRLAALSSAAFLGFGLAIAPAALAGADTPPPAGTTATTAPGTPVVTSAAGTFTVTLPGVGSLSFGVDPTSGALTGLTVAPVDGSGFTAGTPALTEEGVSITFTSGTGSTVLQVEVHPSSTGPVVTAEVDTAEGAGSGSGPGDHPGGTPPGDPHQNSDGHGDEQQGATPPSTVPEPPTPDTSAPPTSGPGGSEGEGGPTPTTVPGSGDHGTGQPGSGAGDTPSGPSDGGRSDGPGGGPSGSGHGG